MGFGHFLARLNGTSIQGSDDQKRGKAHNQDSNCCPSHHLTKGELFGPSQHVVCQPRGGVYENLVDANDTEESGNTQRNDTLSMRVRVFAPTWAAFSTPRPVAFSRSNRFWTLARVSFLTSATRPADVSFKPRSSCKVERSKSEFVSDTSRQRLQTQAGPGGEYLDRRRQVGGREVVFVQSDRRSF